MENLTRIESHFGPRETMDRLEAEIRANGMQVFTRIDHGAGAAEVGMDLRPTELIIFGHARAGTPLMQMSPTLGIDLPLKALVWQDEAGKTWLGYLPPAALARRHGLASEADPIVARMAGMFETLSGRAANS